MEIQDAAFMDVWGNFLILRCQSGLDFAAILNRREAESDSAAGRSHAHNHKLSRSVGVIGVGKIVELVSPEIFIADTNWICTGGERALQVREDCSGIFVADDILIGCCGVFGIVILAIGIPALNLPEEFVSTPSAAGRACNRRSPRVEKSHLRASANEFQRNNPKNVRKSSDLRTSIRPLYR
jgi:hypothetical protein